MTMIDSLVVYGKGIAQSTAISMRETAIDDTRIDCPQIAFRATGNERNNVFQEKLNKIEEHLITVSPNPANTWIEIDYTLCRNLDNVRFCIFTISGEEVANYDLNENTGKTLLDLRLLSPGIYNYTIFSKDISQSGKLVIMR